MTHLNPPCLGRTYKITLLFNLKMTLKPNALPKQGGTGRVSHLNYEQERTLENDYSGAYCGLDGAGHGAWCGELSVASALKKKELPTLFFGGGEFFYLAQHKDTKTRSFLNKNLHKFHKNIFVRFLKIFVFQFLIFSFSHFLNFPSASSCHRRRPRRSR